VTNVHIQLTFVGAQGSTPDPALIGAIARAAVAALRSRGYQIAPVQNGARGAVPFDLIIQLAQSVHDNQAFLLELLKLIPPIMATLLAVRQLPAAAHQPPQISVVIQAGQACVPVPTDRADDNDWLLEQLLAADRDLIAGDMRSGRIAIHIQVAPTRLKH